MIIIINDLFNLKNRTNLKNCYSYLGFSYGGYGLKEGS